MTVGELIEELSKLDSLEQIYKYDTPNGPTDIHGIEDIVIATVPDGEGTKHVSIKVII